MGTGTRAAEDKSWEEVTSMEINPGTPRASPPPTRATDSVRQCPRDLLLFSKMYAFRGSILHHQKSHHDWKLTVTEHDFNTLVLTNYGQRHEACPT